MIACLTNFPPFPAIIFLALIAVVLIISVAIPQIRASTSLAGSYSHFEASDTIKICSDPNVLSA